MERQRGAVDFDADVGLASDVVEVLEEAIGDIDCAADAGLDGGEAEGGASARAAMGFEERRGCRFGGGAPNALRIVIAATMA